MSEARELSRILPHFSRGRFNNHRNEASEDSLSRSLLMYLSSLFVRHNDSQEVIDSWSQPSIVLPSSQRPRITWLGHSTFLIQINGKNILTDPVLSNLTYLFKRILPCGILLAHLPQIDYVLLSHNHRDHMDSLSLYQLKERFPQMAVMVPTGDKKWFDRRGFKNVKEYYWWDQVTQDDIKFSFLPAFHWSQRGLFDRNKSLWGSWMIESAGASIYFAGDTAYADHFQSIAHFYPVIDVALMPIGPCEPRKWMKRSHVNAQEAGQAFLDLNARSVIPMHWGTFYLGTEPFLGPMEKFQAWWQERKDELIVKELLVTKVGQSHELILPTPTKKVSTPTLQP